MVAAVVAAPGLFPSPDRFRDYYARPIEDKGDNERLARLQRRIEPLVLRRTKEQVAADLPPKQEQVLEVSCIRSTARSTRPSCSGSGRRSLA